MLRHAGVCVSGKIMQIMIQPAEQPVVWPMAVCLSSSHNTVRNELRSHLTLNPRKPGNPKPTPNPGQVTQPGTFGPWPLAFACVGSWLVLCCNGYNMTSALQEAPLSYHVRHQLSCCCCCCCCGPQNLEHTCTWRGTVVSSHAEAHAYGYVGQACLLCSGPKITLPFQSQYLHHMWRAPLTSLPSLIMHLLPSLPWLHADGGPSNVFTCLLL